jgi:1-phosphatidylinositol-4-phosphate 5-kinase
MEKIMHALVANEFSSLTGMCTTGKSGSFFYYSDDGKYMLKTISTEESRFLWKFLPDYYFHVYKNPHTLITRFFGYHKIIDCGSNKEIYFVVMGNLFKSDYEIEVKYDLKGSTLGRLTADREDKSIAKKDNNFNLEGRKIFIGERRKEYIMELIKKDVQFLERNSIIDYSLLLGISTGNDKVKKKQGFSIFTEVDDGGMMSENRGELYFLGIIDILTYYGARKKLEHFFKTTVHKKEAVSCAPPAFYAERFLRYMNEVFI